MTCFLATLKKRSRIAVFMKNVYMWLKAFEKNINEPNKREKSGSSFPRKINYYASEMIKREEGPRLIKSAMICRLCK